MTQDEIIKMAHEAGLHIATDVNWMPIIGLKYAEAFANLVAQHVLLNTDPSKFMSYQEGFEAGNRLAIDGICKQLRLLHDSYALASDPGQLRQRGTK